MQRGLLIWVFFTGFSGTLIADSIDNDLRAIQEIGKEGAGFDAARSAMARLRNLPASEVGRVLDAIGPANPVARNWLRGVVAAMSRSERPPTKAAFEEYFRDRSKNPEGRGLAAEWLVQLDPVAGKSLLEQALEDPSLPVRALAVEQAIERAKQLRDSSAAIQEYRRILESARHPQQISEILAALKKFDQIVRPIDHFKFIAKCWTLAPLDNVGGVGFNHVYPVEEKFVKDGTVDLGAQHAGKHGSIQWREVTTDADDGKIDLNPLYNKEKGAVCYVYAELFVDNSQAAQVRLGCICANKVWINGQQVLSNEIYHTGTMIDQYIADVQLLSGKNRILAKICQNEQTEIWAQSWDFQLRVTDPTGKGLVSLENSN